MRLRDAYSAKSIALVNQQVTSSISGLSANITDISGRSTDMSAMADTLTDAIKAFKD